MRIPHLLLPFSIALLTVCCQTSRDIRDTLHRAETMMEQSPDSALLLLERLDSTLLTNRALRARHSLLYSQALDRNYIDLKSDSVIAPAAAYFANHGDERDKAFTHFYLGRIHDNAGFPGEAAKQMLKAEQYAIPAEETKLLSMIYNCRANLYYSQYSFEEALEMYDKADSCTRVEGRTANSALMIKAKAKTYALMARYDEAEAAYREAIELFDSLSNKSQAAICTSSLCTIALDDNRASVDSLSTLLLNSYDRYTDGKYPSSDLLLWARIYLKSGEIDDARYFGNLAIKYSKKSPDTQCGALVQMGRIEQKAGNYKEAINYITEAHHLLDSITDAEKRHLIQLTEKRYQNQELQYQNELLRLQTRLFLILILLIFTIVTFSFVLILRRRRTIIRRKSEEIARHQELIDQLKEDQASLQEQHDRLADNMRGDSEEEVNLLRALENRLSGMQRLLDMAYSGECRPQAFYKAFKEQTLIMNNNERAFSDLQYLVNKRHCGVIGHLRRNYPALTGSELDMLSMILFGFTFDCIRLIYNHDNVDSLYSRRTKIREKLQLPPRTRLERYLEELVEQLRSNNDSGNQPRPEKA